jgi:hypothetical protein
VSDHDPYSDFPPSLWLVCASKVYSGLGADIVDGIISLINPAERRMESAKLCYRLVSPVVIANASHAVRLCPGLTRFWPHPRSYRRKSSLPKINGRIRRSARGRSRQNCRLRSVSCYPQYRRS